MRTGHPSIYSGCIALSFNLSPREMLKLLRQYSLLCLQEKAENHNISSCFLMWILRRYPPITLFYCCSLNSYTCVRVKWELHPIWLLVDFPSCALLPPLSVLMHMHPSDCSFFSLFPSCLISFRWDRVTGDRCGREGEEDRAGGGGRVSVE